MGKPRMIIIVRHAQSEGNRNRAIHQTVPDHRVKLTDAGRQQARDAGRRLRSMLRQDDTLQFYTSPYRRTRETTEGILSTLTGDDDESPSPFPRHTIKVFEEPRLREQDFGNFQPCSSAMERMWQERADYGHFFYRIPNGESAADAYDRVSGFNETLWRMFAEDEFPSVCVLVTHGLMSRVFLMRWFHWSVEYFEDLRNVNHCEFIVMKRDRDTGGKYVLQNELRTWSELKRRAAEERKRKGLPEPEPEQPTRETKRRWGGCPDGCTHGQDDYPRRITRRETKDFFDFSDSMKKQQESSPSVAVNGRSEDVKAPVENATASNTQSSQSQASSNRQGLEEDDEAFPAPSSTRRPDQPSNSDSANDTASNFNPRGIPERLQATATAQSNPRRRPDYLALERDFGGSFSEFNTPHAGAFDDAPDYMFPLRTESPITPHIGSHRDDTSSRYIAQERRTKDGMHEYSSNKSGNEAAERLREGASPSAIPAHVRPHRPEGLHSREPSENTEGRWVQESGMGQGARAERLGDQQGDGDDSESSRPGSGGDGMTKDEAWDKSIRGSVY